MVGQPTILHNYERWRAGVLPRGEACRNYWMEESSVASQPNDLRERLHANNVENSVQATEVDYWMRVGADV